MAEVRFTGARTASHSLTRGQCLHDSDGIAGVGDRAGNIIEVHAGQTLHTPQLSTGTPPHPVA